MPQFVRPGVERLGKQHYRVWWTERLSGKQRSKQIKGPIQAAIDLRDEKISAQLRGEYVPPNELLLRDYLDSWIARLKLLGSQETSTKLFYESRVRALKAGLGHIKLQALTKEHAQAYYVKCLTTETSGRMSSDPEPQPLLVTQNTMSKRHRVLMMALDDAAADGLIVKNPLRESRSTDRRRSDFPKPPKPHAECWTEAEMQTVLGGVSGTSCELVGLIGFSTGMRISEILALRWRDMELPASGGCTITVAGIVDETSNKPLTLKPYGKTSHARRTVSGGPSLADALRRHRREQAERRLTLGAAWADNDLVLCGCGGEILRPSSVSREFSKIVRALEKLGTLPARKTSFHTTRHTHATLLLRAGVPVHVVSKRLGHATIQITLDYYGHVIPSDDASAATTFDRIIAASA